MELPAYIIRTLILLLPSFRDSSRRAFVGTCRAYRRLAIQMANAARVLAEPPGAQLEAGSKGSERSDMLKGRRREKGW